MVRVLAGVGAGEVGGQSLMRVGRVDIRGLDGERKALVYDNYSKLIAATDTIRRMRASMEPLTPTTSTLEPAVSHIESVSRELVVGMRAASPRPERKGAETVRWALGAPERIRELVGAGDREGAERAWELLRGVCGRWEGTRGVEELRKRGEEALGVREVGKMEGGELKVGKMETGEVEAGK